MLPQKTLTHLLIILFLLLTAHVNRTSAVITTTLKQLRKFFSHSHTFLSISTTLVHRVANLRFSRADVDGAVRAKTLAGILEYLMRLRFWPTVLSLCWDFYRYHAWVETVLFKDDKGGDHGELVTRSFTELIRVRNNKEWNAWVDKYYDDLRRVWKTVFSRFHSVLTSGPLKTLMDVLKEEMEKGDFLKDCAEVWAKDSSGLYEILMELSSPYTTYDDDNPKSNSIVRPFHA